MLAHLLCLPISIGCLESADEADKSSDTFQAQSRQAAVTMMFIEPSTQQ